MSIRRIALLVTALAAIFAMSVGMAGAQATAAEGKWTGEINSADASVLVVSGVRFQATGVQVDAGLSLTPGTVVQVKFTAANGSLNAVKVERLEAGDDDLPGTGKITGTIDSATADAVSIGGVPFNVAGARIDDDASLNAGSLVELRFTFNGTALTVSRIEAEDDENDAKAIGVIEAMDATTITVGGVAFDITGAQLDDEGVMAAGVLVKIEFTITDDGRVIALEVEIEDDLSDDSDSSDDDLNADFVLSGTIEAIDGSRLTVNGITVDTNGAKMDDDDTLNVGDAVTIYFQRDASGALSVIEVDEIDDVDDPFDDDRDDDDDRSDDDSRDDVTVINGCVRPDGWQTYRVGRGDTLSQIAGAANTTVDALMSANCLTSANFIVAGQQLFVPIRISRSDDDNDDRSGDDDNGNDNDDNGGDDDNGNDNGDDNGGDDNGNDNDDDHGGDDHGGGDDDGGGDDHGSDDD